MLKRFRLWNVTEKQGLHRELINFRVQGDGSEGKGVCCSKPDS